MVAELGLKFLTSGPEVMCTAFSAEVSSAAAGTACCDDLDGLWLGLGVAWAWANETLKAKTKSKKQVFFMVVPSEVSWTKAAVCTWDASPARAAAGPGLSSKALTKSLLRETREAGVSCGIR
jgi:hypothetical protein